MVYFNAVEVIVIIAPPDSNLKWLRPCCEDK